MLPYQLPWSHVDETLFPCYIIILCGTGSWHGSSPAPARKIVVPFMNYFHEFNTCTPETVRWTPILGDSQRIREG